MRRMITSRRVCGWTVCRACRGNGYRDGSAQAWDRYFRIHDELTAAEDRIVAAYKAGEASADDVTRALEALAAHLLAAPSTDCGECLGVGSVRRRSRATRRVRRRP